MKDLMSEPKLPTLKFRWTPAHAEPPVEPVEIHYNPQFHGDALLLLPTDVGVVALEKVRLDSGEEIDVYAIRVPVRALAEFGRLYLRMRITTAIEARGGEETT